MRAVLKFLKDKAFFALALFLVIAPYVMQRYQFYILQRGVQNSIHVLGLVILVGFTGLLSLGHAGFVALGAYAYGIAMVKLGLPVWAALIIAPLFSMLISMLLAYPSFKLSGPFLVVITIAFGEIVRILILNLQGITGGPYGLTGYKVLFTNSKVLYYVMLGTLFLLALFVRRLGNSRIGLAFKAIKEDEVAADVMGVNVRKHKLMAFMLSSALAGLSGVFLASLTRYINPDSFTFAESSTYLLMVVMGGMQNVFGAITSTIVITALPEVLRFLARSRLLIYSLTLLVYLRMYGNKGGLLQMFGIKPKKANINTGSRS